METYIVEGNISVKAVLQAKRRVVQRIVVDAKKKDKDTSYILRLAKKQGITIQAAHREEIDTLAQGKTCLLYTSIPLLNRHTYLP